MRVMTLQYYRKNKGCICRSNSVVISKKGDYLFVRDESVVPRDASYIVNPIFLDEQNKVHLGDDVFFDDFFEEKIKAEIVYKPKSQRLQTCEEIKKNSIIQDGKLIGLFGLPFFTDEYFDDVGKDISSIVLPPCEMRSYVPPEYCRAMSSFLQDTEFEVRNNFIFNTKKNCFCSMNSMFKQEITKKNESYYEKIRKMSKKERLLLFDLLAKTTIIY